MLEYIPKFEYVPQFDYSKLRGRIKEMFGTYEALCEKLPYGKGALSQRLNNQMFWSQKDICEICLLLNISDCEIPVYFFKGEVRKIEHKKESA